MMVDYEMYCLLHRDIGHLHYWGTVGELKGYLGPRGSFGSLHGVLLVYYRSNTEHWGLLAYCWGSASTRRLQGQGNAQYGGLLWFTRVTLWDHCIRGL